MEYMENCCSESRRPCWVRDQYVTRDEYACASCLRPTFRQIYLIINQSNRKYLTCAQQVTESLFITRTELKRMTEEKKKTVVEQLVLTP